MTTTDFKSLLSKPASEIKRPPTFPEGQYYGVIKSHKIEEITTKNGDKRPVANFMIQGSHPHETIAEEVSALGLDVSKRAFRYTFWLDEESQFRLTEFAEEIGIDTKDLSLLDVINALSGNMTLMDIGKRSSADGNEEYNDVKRLSKAA